MRPEEEGKERGEAVWSWDGLGGARAACCLRWAPEGWVSTVETALTQGS